jgi:glycosyltransferase involved in cell wall biosynthesis
MKLSIITINLNNAGGLQKTIESVIFQTFTDFEYIVIDGNSSDKSIDVIKQYADKIDYWISEPDSGIYNAMNKGIRQAKGEYCLFLNSGDALVDNSVLEKVFKIPFTEDIVYGNVNLLGKNVKIEKKYPNEWTLKLFFDETLPHSASFIKRNLFFEITFYNENYKIISDWEFFVLTIIVHQKSYKHLPIFVTNFELIGLSSTSGITDIEKKKVIETKLKDLLPDLILEFQRELNKYKRSRVINLYDKLLNSQFLLKMYNLIVPQKKLK